MDVSMTTTTFELEGYKVTRGLGVVRGITVRSRSIFGTIGGALQTLAGATSRCLRSSARRPGARRSR